MKPPTEKIFEDSSFKTISTSWKARVSNKSSQLNEFENTLLAHSITLIDSMNANPNVWDESTKWNRKYIGSSYISLLSDSNNDNIEMIYVLSVRFGLELDLNINETINQELDNAITFGLMNVEKFKNMKAQDQIKWCTTRMPIQILKAINSTENMNLLRDVSTSIATSVNIVEGWKTEISEKEKIVTKLKESLDTYKTGFNFVGLYNGFDQLAISKEKEKSQLTILVFTIAALVIVPILIEAYSFQNVIEKDGKTEFLNVIITTIPTLSIVIILIYYFRILMHQLYQVKSQILQIELRKTLCRFIQHYSEYSKEIKANNPDALTKFENMIFAGIVQSDDKIPSTYDGLEKISELLKGIKN